jgi:GLPGLI family protein
MKRLFFLSVYILVNHAYNLQAQTSVQKTAISYSCVFNVLFERGQRYIRFDSKLLSEETGSVFFLTPSSNSINEEIHENEIAIQADTLFRVIKDFSSDALIFGDISFDGKEKFYKDTLHVMSWFISEEKKMIDSFLCYKATTHFKGRNYTAWFCPAIPIPNGPWKLGGLPGLIVEAYEDNKDLYFLLSEIRINNQLPVQKIQQNQKYPNYNSFIQYWKDFFERLSGSLSAQENPDCVSCHSNSKAKAYTWEKIPF